VTALTFKLGEIYRTKNEPRLWAEVYQLFDGDRHANVDVRDRQWSKPTPNTVVVYAEFITAWDLIPYRIEQQPNGSYSVILKLPTGHSMSLPGFVTRQEAGRHIATLL
jgi:hypothetical protein